MRCALSSVAFEQPLDGGDRERQDQSFGLGELERPLERRLGRARVFELLAGGGVEQQGVNRRPGGDQGRYGSLGDGREQRDRPLGIVLGKVDRRGGDPQLGAIAVGLGDAFELGSCRGNGAHPNVHQDAAKAQVDHERVLADEHRLHSFGLAERRQCGREPALSGVQQTLRMAPGQLRRRIPFRTERRLGPLQPPLGLVEPP